MSVADLLTNEEALARRLVRSQAIPHDFWLWLSGINITPIDKVAGWIDAGVLKSIDNLLEPNLVDCNAQTRRQLKGTEAWISAILGFASQRATELKLSSGHPMMALSLLPLYRSLATSRVVEALQQTRLRLSEVLALVGLVEELGDDFVQLLEHHGAPITSPYSIAQSTLKIDLVNIGAMTCQAAKQFDPGTEEFDQANAASSNPRKSQTYLAWSDPKILWEITSELMAQKAELLLPRQWADVAVPWTNISDHWNALAHRLAHSTATTESPEDNGPEYNRDDEIVSDMIDDLLSMQSDVAEVSIEESHDNNTGTIQSADNSAGRTKNSRPLQINNSRSDYADNEQEADEEYPETDILEPLPESSVPKIAVVEISSNRDSMFVNIIRRQIATARNSDNSVCLVALAVESENTAEREPIGLKRASGLLVWQEKLVSWLADHPHVHEPFAFVNPEGQLILCMQDIERTAATNVVRAGIVTALTGKRVEDQGALARVAVPARYYAGIGSAFPNAGFAAEQLIEATWRCLSAAQSQGKTTIKSIEVF